MPDSLPSLAEFALQIIPLLPITKKTKSNYLGSFNRHFHNVIGHKEICCVTKSDLIDAMSQLPQQSKYQALMTARVIFREAEERELISDNPASKIKAPRVNPKQSKFLTWEELEKINFGKQTKRIQFLALHGLRYGEAAALTEKDCKDGLVHINKSKYGPTKTRSGVRSVPQLAEFVAFKPNQNPLARALKPYGVNVHSLRKTYAYTLKKSGVHVTTAAKLMGHANPMVTLKIYTQVLNEETHEAGKSISEFVEEVRFKRLAESVANIEN